MSSDIHHRRMHALLRVAALSIGVKEHQLTVLGPRHFTFEDYGLSVFSRDEDMAGEVVSAWVVKETFQLVAGGIKPQLVENEVSVVRIEDYATAAHAITIKIASQFIELALDSALVDA